GKDIIPSQALALSRYLNRNNIATVDVDYPEAISYLRGEPITVDAPKGYVLVEFEGTPLGWLKNLGNRTNNLYPKEWRIRSTHTPEQPTRVVIGKR
ncbi:MAG: rRNA cytosine-C5-methyltransferase, partial [Muribaculaceae bacterium]|nr:rRNA cytosine-C5-methyltransferase [Muribaculaceae bacterium]